jgi:DNA ligase-1
MKLKKLFSRRSDGGIQQWEMEVEGDKYRAIVGKVGGSLVTAAWTTAKGKNIGRANETSPDQQAAAEAQARWQKKWDEGYRETEADLAGVTLFECMLAAKYVDYKEDVVFPVYCQPKLDGIRCLANAAGLKTRKGKDHMNMDHAAKAVAAVLAKYPGLTLDGEAYGDKLSNDFNTIVHLVKQQKPTAAERAECAKMVQYHVYDCELPDRTATFGARSKFLGEVLSGIPGIVVVETRLCNNQEELDAAYAEYLAAGYEGQMIRTDTPYEHKRTKALLKRKEFVDEEFVIADVEEGSGNRAGMAGAVKLVLWGNAGIRGNEAYFKLLLNNKNDIIGKKATIRYQGKTPDGKLRFPVMVSIRDYE